ncbi:MAG: hypothetical protein SGPRY_001180, partial [Prymnesium sp.]
MSHLLSPFAHAPSLFPPASLPASLRAEVSGRVCSLSTERSIDSLVCSLFPSDLVPAEEGAPAHPSRLCGLLWEACRLTVRAHPLAALEAALAELRDARREREELITLTGEREAGGALARVAIWRREVDGAREDVRLCAKLGHGSVGELAAEVEWSRALLSRLIAMGGGSSPASVEGRERAAEEALAKLRQRERERLKLLRLRNDILGASGVRSEKEGNRGGERRQDTGEETKE